jgi:cation diffusion facilitator CzcD-associated flavoprotein CzcO
MPRLKENGSETVSIADVIVVGAGFGGVYAVHRFRRQGLSVIGLERAGGVGGVWYHNRYPGARVDVESVEYCYHFSNDLYGAWRWTERYASQPEILAYINHVAECFDLKRHFRFNTSMVSGRWDPAAEHWEVRTSAGECLIGRFLVMATGNLSAERTPDFPGLDSFKGQKLQTSHWPHIPVPLKGRKVGVIGTGSSGVQAVPALAAEADQVIVFQRSPNYSVPAQNGPIDEARWAKIKDDLAQARAHLLTTPGGMSRPRSDKTAAEWTSQEQIARLEAQWAYGGHGMGAVFRDQGTNKAANDIVAEFVRDKIRSIVVDPVLAERLSPKDHPIGSRRLVLDTDYYAAFNRENVRLVDLRDEPIERFTEHGLKTTRMEYELDIAVFALGFKAFTGALERANIANADGVHLTDRWDRGPRTYLGLMTAGFPNLFIVTGPGSPSVLANMVIANEHHIDWIGDCLSYMEANRLSTIEPSKEAEDSWTRYVAELSQPLLRLHVRNYMVHVNQDDGSRVFMPYVGGLGRYVEECNAVAANNYDGFRFGPKHAIGASLAEARSEVSAQSA